MNQLMASKVRSFFELFICTSWFKIYDDWVLCDGIYSVMISWLSTEISHYGFSILWNEQIIQNFHSWNMPEKYNDT